MTALGERLSAVIWEGPAERADAHRKCPAGPDGGFACRHAGAGSRSRLRSRARRRLRRRPFARRIFGAGGGRCALASPTRRGCCAFAARRCRRRCRSGSAPWRPCSDSSSMPSSAVAAEAAQGQVCAGRQRQWRRPGRGVGRQGRGRARGRDRQEPGRQARHDAAGVGAVPLRPDAARRRRDGGRRWPRSRSARRRRRWSPT